MVFHKSLLIETEKKNSCLILLLGLCFTSIAFLPEGEIQIITTDTNPITFTSLSRAVIYSHRA